MLPDYERAFKAAADPTRARILSLLDTEELCVCQVVAVLGIAQSTASQQLGVLREAGFIDSSRRGRWVFYRLADRPTPEIRRILGLALDWLRHDPGIKDDRRRLREVTSVPYQDLCRLQAEERRTGAR